MPNPDNMILRTIYVPKELDVELRALAFRRGITKGELMRQLISEGLKVSSGRADGRGFGVEAAAPVASESRLRRRAVPRREPVVDEDAA